MKTNPKSLNLRRLKRQGRLLAFGMTGAMALALTSCNSNSGPVMISPPNGFNPSQATPLTDTNQPPTAPYVYAGSGYTPYLGGRGYYPLYGYPGYYYRPAPGSTVEFVTGATSGYSAGSPEEARESVARGGFGGEGGHGGGE